MVSLLFHKDVFMLKSAQEISMEYQKLLNKYFLSKHFQEHIDNQYTEDRSHTYLPDVIKQCLDSLKETPREVFEVELSKDSNFFGRDGWFVTKYCCRIPYDNFQDLVVAIRPVYKKDKIVNNMVVTAWMNAKNDHHHTLNTDKYCSKEKWKNKDF